MNTIIEKDKMDSISLNYKWVQDDDGTKLLILQDQTGFWQGHHAKISKFELRISNLKMLQSEALLVISRIAYQLKENH